MSFAAITAMIVCEHTVSQHPRSGRRTDESRFPVRHSETLGEDFSDNWASVSKTLH